MPGVNNFRYSRENSSIKGFLISDISVFIKLSSAGSTGGGGQYSFLNGVGGGVSGKTGLNGPALLFVLLTKPLAFKLSNSLFRSALFNT